MAPKKKSNPQDDPVFGGGRKTELKLYEQLLEIRKRGIEQGKKAGEFLADYGIFATTVIIQVGFLMASAFVWWWIDAAISPLILGLVTSLLVAIALDVKLHKQFGRMSDYYDGSSDYYDSRYIKILKFFGLVVLLIPIPFAVISISDRIWAGLATIPLIIYVTWLAFRKSNEKSRLAWIEIGAALLFIPWIIGWTAASLYPQPTGYEYTGAAANKHRGHCGTPSSDMGVALALSGGGYRAAVVHAGLLHSLDKNCIPINLISTVSGGSIIGAAYTLGISPMQFAERLSKSKPGLVTDIVNLASVLRDFIPEGDNISDVYADHFSRVYFSSATLADLPERPILLINATDLNAPVSDAREIFYRGGLSDHIPEGHEVEQRMFISDLVAASGAFPGAFRAKSVRWLSTDQPPKLVDRRFVDGGVVENLGLEGIRRYLKSTHAEDSIKPQILLISDAGKYEGRDDIQGDADALTLLQRSSALQFSLFQLSVYERFTGRENVFDWISRYPIEQQFSIQPYVRVDSQLAAPSPNEIYTIVIPSTSLSIEGVISTQSDCRARDDMSLLNVFHSVRTLPTLAELNEENIQQAFWLGYVLGEAYMSAYHCAVATADGAKCNNAPMKLTCPTIGELFGKPISK